MDATGQQKFRAVDDFTRSDVNAQTAPTEKLSCDTLDVFCEILRTMAASHGHEACGCVLRVIDLLASSLRMCQELLSLFKTDVNAAFRRVPIKEVDRKYGHVVFMYEVSVMF